jgi:hypothetical protein
MSKDQVHSRIKMFAGALSADGTLPSELCSRVAGFVGPTVCARSIGVEFVESRNLALVSIGYSEETGHPVNVSSVKVGQLLDGEDVDLEKIGAQMSEAAAAKGGVVCHEFYVTSDGSVFAVFLAHQLV